MDDQAFLRAFEDGTLTPAEFSHRGHIRMAWLYLRAYGWDDGLTRIREGIQKFAGRLGASNKYHETITVFWARVVHHMISDQPQIGSFEEFLAIFPQILDSRLIQQHYSANLLRSPLARQQWVEPDLLLLPVL
ncbi:MAG: hypothetical protein GC179_09740 [Anaerolineaceae bacterium]|nr:hypothetical protein [Anaerolineaceae bacterium]